MNGNTDIEALVQEGHDVNEEWKRKNADIIRRMEIVKKDEAIRDLQHGILDTLLLFAQLSVPALLACADSVFTPNLDVDSIAQMAVVHLLLQQDEDTKQLLCHRQMARHDVSSLFFYATYTYAYLYIVRLLYTSY